MPKVELNRPLEFDVDFFTGFSLHLSPDFSFKAPQHITLA